MIRLIAIMALLVASPVYSATYYVDQTHGSASDSNAGTSESLPWLTLKHATDTVVAGDTVIVKSGTYTDTSAVASTPFPAFDPVNNGSAGNYITFRSDPALAATVQARQWDGVTNYGYMGWGIGDSSYIEIDGFNIIGGFRAHGGSYVTLKNCVVTQGHTPTDDPSIHWGIGWREVDNGLIQNNHIHSPSSFGNSSHNTGAVMLFGAGSNNVIEYNTVDGDNKTWYNAFGTKGGQTDDNTWRYNFANGVTSGFYGMGTTDDSYGQYRSIIHNNILINSDYFIELYKDSHDFDIYNNTAYNVDYFIYAIRSNSSGHELWNNLIDSNNTDFIHWLSYQDNTLTPASLLDYSDYNNSDPASYWYVMEYASDSYSLSQFVSSTTFGDNSTDSTSPGFINTGGTSAADYKRSTYPADGRGGSYASVMGAYIDGTETVGYAAAGVSTITCYPDVDGDLYPGAGLETVETCSENYHESSHFTAMTEDCDDLDADTNPGETEICGNAVDEDCSGTADLCAGVYQAAHSGTISQETFIGTIVQQ